MSPASEHRWIVREKRFHYYPEQPERCRHPTPLGAPTDTIAELKQCKGILRGPCVQVACAVEIRDLGCDQRGR